MKKKFAILANLLIAVAILLSACAPAQPTAAPSEAPAADTTEAAAPEASPASEETSPPAAEPAGPTEVIVIQNSDPQTMDPQKPGGSTGGNIAFNLFNGLTMQSPDMKEVLPSLATEWHAVDDLTWEFKLREGVKFHNGEDFNAEAVKYTVERLLMPDTVRDTSSFKNLTEVKIVDDYTVQLVSQQPDPLLPAKVFGLHILPPKYAEEVGEEEFGKHPIGTGAYKLVEFVPNQHIILEANPDYWAGKPAVDRLVFKPVAEASTRLAELMSGSADIILDVSPEDIPTVESNTDLRIEAVSSKRVPYIGMDLLPEGPDYLKDVRVRQAMNYAVDVQGIIDALLSGYAERIATIYRPDFMGYDPDLQPYPYDPDKAKELLAEAGYAEGDISLKITANSEVIAKGVEVAEAVAAMLQEVGINAEVNAQSYQGIRDMYIGGQEAHKVDAMWMWNWGSREPDADSPLSGTLHSTGITSYYRDPVLDEMIEDARSTIDQDERIEKHKAIQQYIYDQAPAIFLYVANDIYGVNNRVDWTPRRDQYVLGVDMQVNP
ncbi:MAG: hypothetical protein GYA17_00670 [Chloroflexi bacterium]|nr:ABC transporter substrate-binding protein [Anaerolineaceae bacterium]NMB86837.1 hypothetical protein [Chloroflexota bacterium]